MDVRFRRIALAGAVIAVTGLGSTLAATAVPTPPPNPIPFDGQLPPAMLAAMHRDLGVDEQQARLRLGQQDLAATVHDELASELKGDMQGAYFDEAAGRLVVNLTDADRADDVRRAGAVPKVVANSAGDLSTVTDKLARTAGPGEVASWYVDQKINEVVLSAMPGRSADAQALVARAGAPRELITFRETPSAPEPAVDIRGGDGYSSGLGKCSVGFPIRASNGTAGFITAGHCSMGGTELEVYIGGKKVGNVAGAKFPGELDGAWVKAPGHNPTQLVNDYQGGTVKVTGTQDTPVGGSICRSGDTSGWHCGKVVAKDVTVDYGDLGKVTGLTKTNACADPGDSGGSVLTGDQLQGVASGVEGTCSKPLPPPDQAFYYQEAVEILSKWQLTPIGQGGPPPK